MCALLCGLITAKLLQPGAGGNNHGTGHVGYQASWGIILGNVGRQGSTQLVRELIQRKGMTTAGLLRQQQTTLKLWVLGDSCFNLKALTVLWSSLQTPQLSQLSLQLRVFQQAVSPAPVTELQPRDSPLCKEQPGAPLPGAARQGGWPPAPLLLFGGWEEN